jgi:hypothetical protein
MAMSRPPEQLPCGVELEALVVQVADREPPGDPAHQATCPYCQAALRSVRAGWGDLQALTREPVAMPAGLSARIMGRVHALARHVTDSVLLGHPRGQTRISHALVAKVTQRLALGVPGIVFASARPIAHAPPEPARLAVSLRLVVVFGPAVDALAGAVRVTLDRHVRALTGAELSRIDIVIEDIADRPG